MIIFSICMALGLGLEGLAWFWLWQATVPVWILLGAHLVSTVLVLSGIYQFKPLYIEFNKQVVIMLFLIVLLVPLLGIVGGLVFARMMYVSQKMYQKQNIIYLEHVHHARSLRSKLGPGGLLFRFQSKSMPLFERINALQIASGLPPQHINHLLRTVLPDEQDELRLLSFHLLNNQEKRIVPHLNKALKALKQTRSPEQRAKLHKWLAFQYWELMYRKLIEHALVDFVLNKTLHHAKLARKDCPNDASLWFLIGRAYLRQQKLNLSIKAFKQSIVYGINHSRVLPYLAEAHFYLHQFGATRKALAPFVGQPTVRLSKRVIDFWNKAPGHGHAVSDCR